ncbi:MAG TPA: hypothetical protein VHK28_08600, partial [Candidatus Limnocylindria bacterium]|nr:hypothetical protein [Candidatus Limnocylindria bacterium]
MTDRQLADALRARLGDDMVARLRKLRRRLWLRRAVRIGALTTIAVLGLLAAVQLVARSMPLEAAPWLMAAAGGFGLLAWLAVSWSRRPSLLETAHRADEELALRERLGTAAELVLRPDDRDVPADVVTLEGRQLADARARLAEVELNRAFRPRLSRRGLAAGGIALALLLVLTVWPNPQDGILRDRQAARDASRDVAERIDDVADEAERRGAETDDPRRDELVERLRELARKLRESGD